MEKRTRKNPLDIEQNGRSSANGEESGLAIEVSGLTKSFGETKAVSGINLAVPSGGVYGLLGPNGAGKTTTIRILATLLRPDAGTAKVLGHDITTEADAVRSRVSLTGQFASVDDDLTGLENLILLARLLGYNKKESKARTKELLDAFQLSEAAARQVKTYSGGMRRRLDIAASIVAKPDLLFLDEPTTGLDPRSRNQVWDIIRALVSSGTTVLLTTQYLDEADQLANRIAVIDNGKVIAEGTSGELKASVGSGVFRVRLSDENQRTRAGQILSEVPGVDVHLESDPFELSAQTDNATQATGFIAKLSKEGIEVMGFSLGQPSLDEVFLALTGHPAEEEQKDLSEHQPKKI